MEKEIKKTKKGKLVRGKGEAGWAWGSPGCQNISLPLVSIRKVCGWPRLVLPPGSWPLLPLTGEARAVHGAGLAVMMSHNPTAANVFI